MATETRKTPNFQNLLTDEQVITVYRYLRLTLMQVRLIRRGAPQQFTHPAKPVMIEIGRANTKSTYGKPLFSCKHYPQTMNKGDRRFLLHNTEHLKVMDARDPHAAVARYAEENGYLAPFPLRWEQPIKRDGYLYSAWSTEQHPAPGSVHPPLRGRLWIFEAIGTGE